MVPTKRKKPSLAGRAGRLFQLTRIRMLFIKPYDEHAESKYNHTLVDSPNEAGRKGV